MIARPGPLERFVRALLILLVLLLFLGPIAWVAATAFKDPRDVYALRLLFDPTLANFETALAAPYELLRRTRNSLLVTGSTLVIALPVATLAAYALSRFRFPGGEAWSLGVLATQFVPPVIVAIPLFVAFRSAGLLDTPVALVLANLSFVVPYAIWMIKGFVDALPLELEEAAMLDGASRLRVLASIVVPLARPGIVCAGIFGFVVSWNEFFYALVLTRDRATTLQVGLMAARTERGDVWEVMAVMGLVVMLPMLFLARALQRHLVAGRFAGALR